MDVQISMETTFDDGTRRTHRLGDLSRPYRLTNSEALGLLLSDAKAIISQIQRAILTDQLEEVVAVNRTCSACGSTKPIHDYRTRVFDTAFGRFRHQVPRLKQCKCGVAAGSKCRGEQSPVAKIFPDRATPIFCPLPLRVRRSGQTGAHRYSGRLPNLVGGLLHPAGLRMLCWHVRGAESYRFHRQRKGFLAMCEPRAYQHLSGAQRQAHRVEHGHADLRRDLVGQNRHGSTAAHDGLGAVVFYTGATDVDQPRNRRRVAVADRFD